MGRMHQKNKQPITPENKDGLKESHMRLGGKSQDPEEREANDSVNPFPDDKDDWIFENSASVVNAVKTSYSKLKQSAAIQQGGANPVEVASELTVSPKFSAKVKDASTPELVRKTLYGDMPVHKYKAQYNEKGNIGTFVPALSSIDSRESEAVDAATSDTNPMPYTDSSDYDFGIPNNINENQYGAKLWVDGIITKIGSDSVMRVAKQEQDQEKQEQHEGVEKETYNAPVIVKREPQTQIEKSLVKISQEQKLTAPVLKVENGSKIDEHMVECIIARVTAALDLDAKVASGVKASVVEAEGRLQEMLVKRCESIQISCREMLAPGKGVNQNDIDAIEKKMADTCNDIKNDAKSNFTKLEDELANIKVKVAELQSGNFKQEDIFDGRSLLDQCQALVNECKSVYDKSIGRLTRLEDLTGKHLHLDKDLHETIQGANMVRDAIKETVIHSKELYEKFKGTNSKLNACINLGVAQSKALEDLIAKVNEASAGEANKLNEASTSANATAQNLSALISQGQELLNLLQAKEAALSALLQQCDQVNANAPCQIIQLVNEEIQRQFASKMADIQQLQEASAQVDAKTPNNAYNNNDFGTTTAMSPIATTCQQPEKHAGFARATQTMPTSRLVEPQVSWVNTKQLVPAAAGATAYENIAGHHILNAPLAYDPNANVTVKWVPINGKFVKVTSHRVKLENLTSVSAPTTPGARYNFAAAGASTEHASEGLFNVPYVHGSFSSKHVGAVAEPASPCSIFNCC